MRWVVRLTLSLPCLVCDCDVTSGAHTFIERKSCTQRGAMKRGGRECRICCLFPSKLLSFSNDNYYKGQMKKKRQTVCAIL